MGVGNHGGAENVREALEWDSVPHMVRELKDGKEVLKMYVSDWDSTFNEFFLNLRETSRKGGRPQEYVYFLTHRWQAGTLSSLAELGALSPIWWGIMVLVSYTSSWQQEGYEYRPQ